MSRAFCIPGVILLFCALVLSFLASISLPFLPGLDIVRTQLNGEVSVQGSQELSQIRFGIWAPCYYGSQGDRTCFQATHGYTVSFTNTNGSDVARVSPAWTRGLVVQPVATVVTFLAFFFGLFSNNRIMPIISSLVSFLAALLTLIAFAIDIALLALVRFELDRIGSTNTGPGFWLTFVSLILLLVGGCTVCCGHRRDRLSNATTTNTNTTTSKKPIWSRFKRNQ